MIEACKQQIPAPAFQAPGFDYCSRVNFHFEADGHGP